MLDVNDFIAERGGDPDKIRASQRARHAPEDIVDQVIAAFHTHRTISYEATQLGSRINEVQKQIGLRKRAREDAADLLSQKEAAQAEKRQLEDRAAELHADLLARVKTVGNYVHESVPVSATEDDNAVVAEWAPERPEDDPLPAPRPDPLLSHHQVLARLAGYDSERAIKLVGHRGYCLTGHGFWLNQALIQYAMQFLHERGYCPNQPPYFMKESMMGRTAQLSTFAEDLYRVTGGGNNEDGTQEENMYLIATSEQPISCLHAEEWMQKADLPIKYAGYSTCFRKEAGSHGRDAWGLFRVHQFEKVEQFIFCQPEDSWTHLEDMIGTAKDFYQTLKIPYRVVAIVSSALNNAAAKKYDLEARFPFQDGYKELVSASNCTDYQTRELEVRFGSKPAKEAPGGTRKTYVHALNATLCATERTLCCILENYQTDKGVVVPEVLRRFIPGQPDFLPYVKELPKEIPVRGKK